MLTESTFFANMGNWTQLTMSEMSVSVVCLCISQVHVHIYIYILIYYIIYIACAYAQNCTYTGYDMIRLGNCDCRTSGGL